MIDANQEETKINPLIPNRDSNCLSTTGPYTNLPIWIAPSNGPSSEDKKSNAVAAIGKTSVVNPEEIPFFLNFSCSRLSIMYGRKLRTARRKILTTLKRVLDSYSHHRPILRLK